MSLNAIYLVDEGVYLLEGQSWGYTYEADGMPAPKSGQFVVGSLANVVRVETKPGDVIAWKSDDGAEMSERDHADKLAELLTGADRDDDGDYKFPNLDAEFEWRKFIARWASPVRAPSIEVRTPIEVPVTEVRVRSGDVDIVSLWNAPHVSGDRRLYTLEADAAMVREAIRLCAKDGLRFDNDSHPSHLRFAKIEGDYAFDDSFDKRRRPFIGTLEQCRQEKAESLERVAKIIRVRAAKKRGIELQNAGDVVLELKRVHINLTGVRARQDSSTSLHSATKAVAALIVGIEASLARALPQGAPDA